MTKPNNHNMAFQINNPEGKPILLSDLDKEACELWGVTLNITHYAHPNMPCYTNSWYDSIGWVIDNPEDYTGGWEGVKRSLWVIQAKRLYDYLDKLEEIIPAIEEIKEFHKPYYDLIDH